MARHDREESLEEQLAWLDAIKEQEEAPPVTVKSGVVDDTVISPYPKDPWSAVPAEPDTTSSSLFRMVADPSNHLVSSLSAPAAPASVEDADAAEWMEAGAFSVPPPSPSPNRDDEAFLAPLKPLPRQDVSDGSGAVQETSSDGPGFLAAPADHEPVDADLSADLSAEQGDHLPPAEADDSQAGPEELEGSLPDQISFGSSEPSEDAFEQDFSPVGHGPLDDSEPGGLQPFTPSAGRQDAFPLSGDLPSSEGVSREPSPVVEPPHANEERAVPDSTDEAPEDDRSPQATVSDALRQAAGGGALGQSHQSSAFARDWGRAFTSDAASAETPPQGSSSFPEEPPAREGASFRDVSFSREALFAQGEPNLKDLPFPQSAASFQSAAPSPSAAPSQSVAPSQPAAPSRPAAPESPVSQEAQSQETSARETVTPPRGVSAVPERDFGAPGKGAAEPVRESYQARRRHSAPPPAFSVPSRQTSGSRPSADSLDPDSLLRGRRNAPSSGWRRLIYTASAGLIKPGESPEVRRRRELATRARTPVATGHHRVAVLSLKGGVGKTTTTVGLGATLAQSRGDRVIAVDANPDRGTLSDKVKLETAATVRDLLNERKQIKRYVDVRAFTSQAPSRLEILASDRDPSVSEAFSASDYQAVAQVLENFYSICITDCGTGLLHSAMSGVLGLADQLVLVSSPSVDGARAASATLDWLEAHHYEELVRSATVVLCSVRPRSKSTVDLDRLEAHFAARCRAVIRVPYDPHLEEGAEIELDRLQPATRDAYLRLAASVGDGFAIPQPT
ncbi:AAA family ATPase [Streptosporangium sp. NPDC001559]|uniref:MinD/ParA family ATP-binding protein n=1 Tax=Streptosporangium sp. NPDC001559 TaxID=3366187 RepID=UPI0036E6D1C8